MMLEIHGGDVFPGEGHVAVTLSAIQHPRSTDVEMLFTGIVLHAALPLPMAIAVWWYMKGAYMNRHDS